MKKLIKNTVNSIRANAIRLAATYRSGEGYIDTAVKILIAVVLGALLWQDGLLQLFHYIEANRTVCLCALNSVGRDCLKRFFEADIYYDKPRLVQLGEQIGACAVSDPSADVDMVTHFYIVAASGLIESWLTGELDKSPEEIVSFLDVIIHDHVRGAAFRLGTSDRLI